MKGILLNKGWTINYECHCSGVHRIEFVNALIPGAIVKIYPKKERWRASRKGRRIGEGTTDNFEIFINGLVE